MNFRLLLLTFNLLVILKVNHNWENIKRTLKEQLAFPKRKTKDIHSSHMGSRQIWMANILLINRLCSFFTLKANFFSLNSDFLQCFSLLFLSLSLFLISLFCDFVGFFSFFRFFKVLLSQRFFSLWFWLGSFFVLI